ncbi:PAAR domain-containing protein [bacterium]|nr:PAAR domain-containing protein [candidate division CSSED10-310 bacterium]
MYKYEKITKTVHVNVVSTAGYASVGSRAVCLQDAHGCPACPHKVAGPVLQGSPHVLIDGQPAARVGDTGLHASCCGANTFKIAEGDPNVLIDGKPAARSGCKTIHCGGIGHLE